ncbi:MAG: hypothetical protein ABI448_01275 [Bacteroidia bacterium]
MKQLFLLLIAFVFLSSVNAQNQAKTKQAMYVNINIDIAYTDKAGNDLLDANNDNHFDAKDITIYNMVNGEKIKVNKPGRDYPNNHFIFKDEAAKTNYLRVFLETEMVLVQLNATTTDTIKCTLKKTKGNTHIEKVWYNGKCVFKYGKTVSQAITIVK